MMQAGTGHGGVHIDRPLIPPVERLFFRLGCLSQGWTRDKGKRGRLGSARRGCCPGRR